VASWFETRQDALLTMHSRELEIFTPEQPGGSRHQEHRPNTTPSPAAIETIQARILSGV
jgi:hypothetical protein